MTESRVVLAVVAILGTFALVGLGGTIYLIALDKSASDLNVIITPTATALGALGAMLVSTRSTDSPQDVTITNTEADPVPTTPSRRTP